MGGMQKLLDANFIYIHGIGDNKPYALTAIRKDMNWNDYGGVRRPERVGIEIRKTRMINVYHHREKTLDITGIKREILDSNLKRWVCSGDFNCHRSLWDGDGVHLRPINSNTVEASCLSHQVSTQGLRKIHPKL
jgi:hypothetical protein